MFMFTNDTGLYTIKWAFPKRMPFFALGYNIDKTCSASICLCFAYNTTCREYRELIMSVLNSSNRFPIFSLVTPPLTNLCILNEVSHVETLLLIDPLELLKKSATIVSYDSLDISP